MARLVEALPAGRWLYELKFGGYRALAFKAGRQVTLLSRNRKDGLKVVEGGKIRYGKKK
jgi:bifunctional non-homologous end joining protein LigD